MALDVLLIGSSEVEDENGDLVLETVTLASVSFTANFRRIAKETGVLYPLWELRFLMRTTWEWKDINSVQDLIPHLERALHLLNVNTHSYYELFVRRNNNWGTVEDFETRLQQLLDVCRENPSAQLFTC